MKILIIILIIVIMLLVAAAAFFMITKLMGAPFVPSPRDGVEDAFTTLYPLSENDYVVDMGAGSGVALESVSRHGAKGLGIELNPFLALYCHLKFIGNRKIRIKCRNFYYCHFPAKTTVVYVYSTGLHIRTVYRKIYAEAVRLDKTLILVSKVFAVPGVEPEKSTKTHSLYIVKPAKKKNQVVVSTEAMMFATANLQKTYPSPLEQV